MLKLAREHKAMVKSPNELFTATPRVTKTLSPDGEIVDDLNYMIWDCVLHGPKDTPYEGGRFHVCITPTANYPFKPPIVMFKTRIYHPNISAAGHVCMDILKHNWSPVFGIEKILLSISSILSAPNPNDPLDIAIGKHMTEDPESFAERAREYTKLYA